MIAKRRYQRTLYRPAFLEGRGYWSGQEVRVEFHPAAADSGVVFRRMDLLGAPPIPARVWHRVEMPRRTTLKSGFATVEMVEHLLAALAGLRIDNCEVRVNSTEMPGNDGSCQEAVESLLQAGIVEQETLRTEFSATESIRVVEGSQWIELRPASQPGLHVTYELDYGAGNAVGRQSLEMMLEPESFRTDIAPARTFVLQSEAIAMRAQGIGTHTTYQDLLVFGDAGPIDNTLRFPDECARHKVLDLVGDLALAGCDFQGQVIAHRTGHRLNAELVRAVMARHKSEFTHRKIA